MLETLNHTIIVTAICLKKSFKIFSPQIKLKGHIDVCVFGFYTLMPNYRTLR